MKVVESEKSKASTQSECFVIMPIADTDGYDQGHFSKVYEDIFKPACEASNFKPVRADEVKETNLIHLDILQKLIDSPMAICDLSSRNPNVLFELGLRQAFDKPTVLVQEKGTPKIFDIAPLRYTEYRRELKYREVLEDQKYIADAISATKASTAKGDGVNSIVRILSLSKPATLKEVAEGDSSGLLQLVRAEMSEMRSDFRRAMTKFDSSSDRAPLRAAAVADANRRRLIECNALLAEASERFERDLSTEGIIKMTTRVHQLLSRLLDSDISEDQRAEALQMGFRATQIERLAIDRQSKQ